MNLGPTGIPSDSITPQELQEAIRLYSVEYGREPAPAQAMWYAKQLRIREENKRLMTGFRSGGQQTVNDRLVRGLMNFTAEPPPRKGVDPLVRGRQLADAIEDAEDALRDHDFGPKWVRRASIVWMVSGSTQALVATQIRTGQPPLWLAVILSLSFVVTVLSAGALFWTLKQSDNRRALKRALTLAQREERDFLLDQGIA